MVMIQGAEVPRDKQQNNAEEQREKGPTFDV